MLKPAELKYPTQQQALLAIVHALTRIYCMDQPALVETDNEILEGLFQQLMADRRLARWYDILADNQPTFQYLPGAQNGIADTLSRRQDMKPESKTFHELAVPSFSESVVVHDPELVEAIQGGYRKAKRIQAIKAAVAARAKQATKTSRKHARALGFHAFFIEHAVLWFQSAIDAQLQLVVPNIQELNHRIITEAHDLIYGGYAGVHRTYLRLSDSWYWFKMVRSIHKYECEPCRRNKPRLTKPTGLVEPLAVPEERWREISMDFITDLPRTKAGHDAILVGVDGLMKCMRFFVTKKTMTAPEVANPLIEHIWKLRARSDHV